MNIDVVSSGDGSSWENALDEQGFIDKLDAASGDLANTYVFWVAKGTYRPTIPAEVWDLMDSVEKSFQLPPNVKLYGGFAGAETALDQRNWETNTTTLTGRVSDDENMMDDYRRVYHVVVVSGDGNEAVLDGFTITLGRASGSWGNANIGGGALIVGASPTIENCIFTGNEAGSRSSPSSGLGGAIANIFTEDQSGGSGHVKIINSRFVRNNATRGGGALLVGYDETGFWSAPTFSMQVTIESCDFSSNVAQSNTVGEESYGGAIANSAFSSGHMPASGTRDPAGISLAMTIRDSLFFDNAALVRTGVGEPFGGGAIANSGLGFATTDVDITGTRFVSNTVDYSDPHSRALIRGKAYGGAILNGIKAASMYASAVDLKIKDSTFWENLSLGDGGAIYSNGEYTTIGTFALKTSVAVDSSTFYGNRTTDDGGAVASALAYTSIVNSTFDGNTGGGSGGAIFSVQRDDPDPNTPNPMSPDQYVNLLLVNSTFAGNEAYTGAAGYTASADTNALLVNNIFWENDAGGTAEIELYDSTVELVKTIVDGGVSSVVTNGSSILTGGADILTGDPLLSALADNGGATMTMEIAEGGAAVKNGLSVGGALSGSHGSLANFTLAAVPNVDQRNSARADNADIGAYEIKTTPPVIPPVDCEGDCGSGCGVLPGAFALLAMLGLPLVIRKRFR